MALVSGGDPGIFAMAAALIEAAEAGEPVWRALDIEVLPGISAMQAAAARLGRRGHDFCAISLSDNLKPWDVVARRLRCAAEGDFVIALYNPASKARPRRIHDAFALLRSMKAGATPVAFARAVGRADEKPDADEFDDADPGLADMATLVMIGSSETRWVARDSCAPLDADAAQLRSPTMSLDPGEHPGQVGRSFAAGGCIRVRRSLPRCAFLAEEHKGRYVALIPMESKSDIN